MLKYKNSSPYCKSTGSKDNSQHISFGYKHSHNRRSNHLWHLNQRFKQNDVLLKHSVIGNDFTGKTHQPRWSLLTWYCDSLFHYNLTGKPEHSVILPPANLSISLRSHGALWISCVTSLAVTEQLKQLQTVLRLHQESSNEEVTSSLQEVLLLQRPFGLAQTLCQNCTN